MDADEADLHILVIDDDEAMRALLTEILLPDGHQVVSAASAEEGLELLPYFSFQVAFLDHHLPGMEGLVLAEYLLRSNPDMQVALVTATVDDRVRKTSIERDIAIVPKPFRPSEILDIVATFRSKAESRAERRRARSDARFAPSFAEFASELKECFDVPGVPQRIEERLIRTIKRCLNDLRTTRRYNERDRVVALAGLLTLRVLGISAPNMAEGRSLDEEYDALMIQHGRRPEFSPGSKSEHE